MPNSSNQAEPNGGKAAGRRFAFGAVVFNEQTLELTVGAQPVVLERKPLEVLRHLLHHAGEVVTKDELAEACWPGRILSDTVLAKTVSRLREGLGDEQQELIKTQHGYGYRLVAPVRVETIAAAAGPRLDFRAGDTLPLRPLWKLEQHLGGGGYGEAWLARHDKTHEARVFKFALDGAALSSLKREITLYRLLRDTLGEREDFVRVLDWNLDEPPYFVEFEHSNGGNLHEWAESQGGLSAVPLASRIAMAIRIAEALAACHSVGVLHKDLKPANVLVATRPGSAPAIKLADFGSGGLLDPGRLESLGITRLGFTQAMADGGSGGTPLYVPPEVLAGQPSTVQADIYALGVLLYQLAISDLRKPLASGWEHDIADELLREDIAEATNGNPARRLADAARLAERLALLGPRREQRAREARERATAEAQQRLLERMRARRSWMLATMTALIVGLATSFALYLDARRARNEAAEAAEVSKAVSDFLGKDMFGILYAEQRPVKNLTVKELLDAASAQVDKRFADTPEAGAQVHSALGGSYAALEYPADAVAHLDQAVALFEVGEGDGSASAIEAAAQLVEPSYVLGQLAEILPELEALLARGTLRLGSQNSAVLQLRQKLAWWAYAANGDFSRATAELRAVIDAALKATPPQEALAGEAEQQLGQALVKLSEFREAEPVLRSSVARLTAKVGFEHQLVALARMSLAHVLTELERYADAEKELIEAERIAKRWSVDNMSAYYLAIRTGLGELRVRQNRSAEAAGILQEALDGLMSATTIEIDQSAPIRVLLAEALRQQGRMADATASLRAALAASEASVGAKHISSQRIRVALAGLLYEQDQLAQAKAVAASLESATFAALPPHTPALAELRRLEGLFALRDRKSDAAQAAFTEALRILESRYGAHHWRTRRARADLESVPPRTMT